MHSIHMYTFDKDHYANACSPKAAERAIEITAALIDLARCDFSYDDFPDSITTRPKSRHRPTICFDEWNLGDRPRKPAALAAIPTPDQRVQRVLFRRCANTADRERAVRPVRSPRQRLYSGRHCHSKSPVPTSRSSEL